MDNEAGQKLAMGVVQQAQGNLAQAEEIYREVLRTEPQNIVAHFLLTQVNGSLEADSPTERRVLEDFRRLQTPYFAGLPYNLNWILHDLNPVRGFLAEHPIIVADIGARGGRIEEFGGLQPFTSYYGFDADIEECARMEADTQGRFAEARFLPYYLGKQEGLVDFYIYKNPGDSSGLRPNAQFQKKFIEDLRVERTVQVQSNTLDNALYAEKLALPDMLKLDTQGNELDILESSPEAVRNAALIDIEVQFTPQYEGARLFHEVARFMDEKGFDLLYLNRVFQNRRSYGGEARGQLTFGDALFGRRETHLDGFTPERMVKYMLLLINYGHLDIAHEIWEVFPAARSMAPGLSSYFSKYGSDDDRIIAMAHDKILCWQLHRRRTNQIDWDSDRSWPIR